MGRARAQGHRRQTRRLCPHGRPWDITDDSEREKGRDVNRTWTTHTEGCQQRRRIAVFAFFKANPPAAHRQSTVWDRVDCVWTAMYESNQRSKSHNKSL